MAYTLKLTLKKAPFDVMVTGEKSLEIRKPSKWILSRLKHKPSYVLFTNGYGKNKRAFVAKFCFWCLAKKNDFIEYSNGLKVEVNEGDEVIKLGWFVDAKNLK